MFSYAPTDKRHIRNLSELYRDFYKQTKQTKISRTVSYKDANNTLAKNQDSPNIGTNQSLQEQETIYGDFRSE